MLSSALDVSSQYSSATGFIWTLWQFPVSPEVYLLAHANLSLCHNAVVSTKFLDRQDSCCWVIGDIWSFSWPLRHFWEKFPPMGKGRGWNQASNTTCKGTVVNFKVNLLNINSYAPIVLPTPMSDDSMFSYDFAEPENREKYCVMKNERINKMTCWSVAWLLSSLSFGCMEYFCRQSSGDNYCIKMLLFDSGDDPGEFSSPGIERM